MANHLQRAWYGNARWVWLLLPLAWLFQAVALLRRRYYLRNLDNRRLPVQVVVVGNLTVGGTGKTPFLISLVKHLQAQGRKPGVVSRGYGGHTRYPCLVSEHSRAQEVGDEPLLIAEYCPVVVDPNRYRAAHYLLQHTHCDLILSDDGLQHYRLPRTIEIAVVDGQRYFGNGFCLPAGPLREPLSRLRSVDFVVVNAADEFAYDAEYPNCYPSRIQPVGFRNLVTHKTAALDALRKGVVHAVAGIGNPERFVETLQRLGFIPQLHAYPDHHVFSGKELVFYDGLPVIITAKDAVKCQGLGNENVWILDIAAIPSEDFWIAFDAKLT